MDSAWGGTAIPKYLTKTDSEIINMPFADTFEVGAILMWTTKRKLEFAIKCLNN